MIEPLVEGGFYGTATLPEDRGLLVALGGDPISLYVGQEATVECERQDRQTVFFRVTERVQFVARDPRALVRLDFDFDAVRTQDANRNGGRRLLIEVPGFDVPAQYDDEFDESRSVPPGLSPSEDSPPPEPSLPNDESIKIPGSQIPGQSDDEAAEASSSEDSTKSEAPAKPPGSKVRRSRQRRP
jgi:hypothetical protein